MGFGFELIIREGLIDVNSESIRGQASKWNEPCPRTYEMVVDHGLSKIVGCIAHRDRHPVYSVARNPRNHKKRICHWSTSFRSCRFSIMRDSWESPARLECRAWLEITTGKVQRDPVRGLVMTLILCRGGSRDLKPPWLQSCPERQLEYSQLNCWPRGTGRLLTTKERVSPDSITHNAVLLKLRTFYSESSCLARPLTELETDWI